MGPEDFPRAHLPESRASLRCVERKRYRDLYLFGGYLLNESLFVLNLLTNPIVCYLIEIEIGRIQKAGEPFLGVNPGRARKDIP